MDAIAQEDRRVANLGSGAFQPFIAKDGVCCN